MNIYIQVFVWVWFQFSWLYVSSSGSTRSYGNSTFNFLKNCQTVSKVTASFYIPTNNAWSNKSEDICVSLCYTISSCQVVLEQREENSRTCSLQGLLTTWMMLNPSWYHFPFVFGGNRFKYSLFPTAVAAKWRSGQHLQWATRGLSASMLGLPWQWGHTPGIG